MNFIPPPGLDAFEVLFDHSEPNVFLPAGLQSFVGNLGFPPPPVGRPWIYANFVQTIDGLVSFGGLQPGGEWVARSPHDRWMMDLLRAQADAVICGARSLVLEAQYGRYAGGPVYRIVDEGLLGYREQVLGRRKLVVILVTGSGRLDLGEYKLFRSDHVEAWIATTPLGRTRLKGVASQKILVSGEEDRIDLTHLAADLYELHGVRYLLCEGGPFLYGEMMRARLVDEKFLTVAPQEIGIEAPEQASASEAHGAGLETTKPSSAEARLTSFSGPGFSVDTAQWYRWISCRRAGDHAFLRYRARRD